MCGGDAAFRQITVTTYYYRRYDCHHFVYSGIDLSVVLSRRRHTVVTKATFSRRGSWLCFPTKNHR